MVLMQLCSVSLSLFLLFVLLIWSPSTKALREFRSWSTRQSCDFVKFPNYPFAYSKYAGQLYENKGRVNSNLQDFRHECQVLGGLSKCHICEDIECGSSTGVCHLQFQGVVSTYMASNVPTVSDTAWAVGGAFRRDYGGSNVTHFCVFLSGGQCINPYNMDFSNCTTRCFGYGFGKGKARVLQAANRTIVDIYDGMGRWPDDGQVDIWSYPRNCTELQALTGKSCVMSGMNNKVPDFNPQGYVFTMAGSGIAGFQDSPIGTNAQFNNPTDLVVDRYNNIYVADFENHAIRWVHPNGAVSTIAGNPRTPGYSDGPCSVASFFHPRGLDVIRQVINGIEYVVIAVADTGNHRIRKIIMNPRSAQDCNVYCLTGLCGNNSLSAVDYTTKAYPISGYADGAGSYARFSAPESVAIMDGNMLAVADTGNFLIRWVNLLTGDTNTLAGQVIPGERDPSGNPLAGCTPPCMQGQQGFNDGNLNVSQFYNPVDVNRGPNNTLWVVDEHRIRMIELPGVTTSWYTIQSQGRVSTVAGTALQGHEDDLNDKATFFEPGGVYISNDNVAYVADQASCRIRRITPLPSVAQKITCSTNVIQVVRPSGCTSFDQPVDKIGRKVSRLEANLYYNYGPPNVGNTDAGKYIKNCVGTPPPDTLDKHFLVQNVSGDNLVVDDQRTVVNEDSEQGMSLMFQCPASCAPATKNSRNFVLQGTTWYSESSSICKAAIHSGAISNKGGYIRITIERGAYLWTQNPSYTNGSVRFNITSTKIPPTASRVFMVEPLQIYQSVVHTIGGHPAAPLESGCGFADAQPPTLAYFNRPRAVASNRFNRSITDSNFLYIADTGNHRIRALSAVCTQICENKGRCVGQDLCQCQPGWGGIDCTIPQCTSPCGQNKVCAGPNLCACKPGYTGPNCNIPQCTQTCLNGGTCSAPDTCSCPVGWFDSNCTTPVCSLTCGNGGNCTAPDTCACPSQWQGSKDCRIPVCKQKCHNGGLCVAPNTCVCPPQYTGYDCTVPVCTQGFFRPNPPDPHNPKAFASSLKSWEMYRPCDIPAWCNATNEFECDQLHMSYGVIEVPSGPKWRAITGHKDRPKACMNIEVSTSFKLPFGILNADNSSITNRRYSPVVPYASMWPNPWRGLLTPIYGHTGPWTYSPDRQVAMVNWLNQSQGIYVCANNGNCTAPNVCQCAPGWIGFDCRTPICGGSTSKVGGYYFDNQTSYVSGQKTPNEIDVFSVYMDHNNSYRLQWPYSNPNYTIQFEFYNASLGPGTVIRDIRFYRSGTRYQGPLVFNNATKKWENSFQGGYRCSIRAFTQWENPDYVHDESNFYSTYMDSRVQSDGKVYTYWGTKVLPDLMWPPTHRRSRSLDKRVFNISFAYTNNGWRRGGIWNTTGIKWQYGLCIIEFQRNCSDKSKEKDLHSGLTSVIVQDTDLAYRPRIFYNDFHVYGEGRWKELGGECVDQVKRGCYNNGTCIAPGVCQCSEGWQGADCQVPICSQTCHHAGFCSLPNVCTCARGWTGPDCQIPLCAQECQNGGKCVAPDTCSCNQWPNEFRDGRKGGGWPIFINGETGDPLPTGWTGFDCSTPICVQAAAWIPNNKGATYLDKNLEVPYTTYPYTVPAQPGFYQFGGHGGDANLLCTTTGTSSGTYQPRCPQFDVYVTGNEARTFQTGCGYDPYDTGCCRYFKDQVNDVTCYKCDNLPEFDVHGGLPASTNNTFYCRGNFGSVSGRSIDKTKFKNFLDRNQNFKWCGKYHSPRKTISTDASNLNPTEAVYYRNRFDYLSSHNMMSNLTSNRFLCNIIEWEQGDYNDDAGLGTYPGVNSIHGLSAGRHIRINTPGTYTKSGWKLQRGEGIYVCANSGSCLGPDICTCEDGYEGVDCKTPQCRHQQPPTEVNPQGAVTACLHQGICTYKDHCNCVTTQSNLWVVHPEAPRATTGWTGTDCSMPMCAQGFYDPYCTDLPQAPGGEGCYRCANGGNCTAPDICECADGWTGYDCKTPVCNYLADPLTRIQLNTVYEDNVIAFENDPCAVDAIYGKHGWKGLKYARGNCTMPNTCTCLCKAPYSRKACHLTGQYCDGPWQDPLIILRNVLQSHGPMWTFGSTDCALGYEGNMNDLDQFVTCHLNIYEPNSIERSSVQIILAVVIVAVIFSIFYYFFAARIRRRILLAKIERRRSKRSSEDSLLAANAGAFTNK